MVRRTAKTEGITALYKGIKPPIIAETPKRAIKFFVFGYGNKYLTQNTQMSVGLCGSLAGLGSGVTEAVFVTPFERVKILLQTQKGSLKGKESQLCNEILKYSFIESKGAMQQLKSVYRTHGLSTKGGLFTGCTATVGMCSKLKISEIIFK